MYYCDKCDSKFGYKSNLNRLMKNKHNNVDSLIGGLSTQSESAENSVADTEEEMRFGNDDTNIKEDEADDMNIDSDDEKDENYEAWILLNNFIIVPEMNLIDKYILFRKLLIKAYKDSTFKTTLEAIQYFKDKLGFNFIITTQCTIRFLEPVIKHILYTKLKDDFWEYFLELAINENTNNIIDEEYLKLVMNNYENLFILTSSMESDILNKKIVKRKNKLVKKYNFNEIDGFTNAVKREVAQFNAMKNILTIPIETLSESE